MFYIFWIDCCSTVAAFAAETEDLFISEAFSEVAVVDDLNRWHDQNNEDEINWDNNCSEDAKRADWHNLG